MNPFLRYLADKQSAHRHTDRQTDRHTPMTTRPCGLRRAGNQELTNRLCVIFRCTCIKKSLVTHTPHMFTQKWQFLITHCESLITKLQTAHFIYTVVQKKTPKFVSVTSSTKLSKLL